MFNMKSNNTKETDLQKVQIIRLMNRPGFIGSFADAQRQWSEENKMWNEKELKP